MPLENVPRQLSRVFYEIVKGCQLSCVGCPISTLKPRVECATLEQTDRCLRNIDVEAIGTMALYGYGEPLLHDDLPGLFEVVRRQAWRTERIEISTNAQHADWKQLEEVFRMRALTDLIVSCDGDGSPASYEELRPPSRWSCLMEFLLKAAELRDRLSPGTRLVTRTIIFSSDDRGRWRALLGPLGWESDFRSYSYLPESAAVMTGRRLEPASGTCFFVRHNNVLYVNLDGTVIPCCMHPRAGVYGNLSHQRFSEIVAGSARAEFIKELETRRESMRICGQCEMDGTVENEATRASLLNDDAFIASFRKDDQQATTVKPLPLATRVQAPPTRRT